MTNSCADLLCFEERYFERIWGGDKLRRLYGKPAPENASIGEAWLVADHRECESRVSGGPCAGRTLRELLEEDAASVLGARAKLTVHGRFPLLLKLLDAQDVLSVQVHPDDDCATRLDEPDVGKTEMWHVLQADPGSELIVGLDPNVGATDFEPLVSDGKALEDKMRRHPVESGDSVFVPAGTVHAIGAGIVLAEIQQNSDLTYRLYDWGRVQADGPPRTLHLYKAREAIHFGSEHRGKTAPLTIGGDAPRTLLAACAYFAAEAIRVDGRWRRDTRGDSFHILLVKEGEIRVEAGAEQTQLAAGECVLVPGRVTHFAIEGRGAVLDYYVPDLREDIVAPLRQAGYSEADLKGINPALTFD